MDKVRTTKSVVAVFGATGHTGRFVIAELMRRGVTPVVIARDAAALAEATFPEPDVLRRHATIDEAASLETGRSNQHFVVDVVVTRGDERRRATVRGRDIYAISAPLVCEAVERLLVGKFSATGAHAPGEIFDAGDILAALGPDNSTFEVFAA